MSFERIDRSTSKVWVILILVLFDCSSDKEVQHYPNGNLKSEVEINHGQRDGLMRIYFETGEVLKEMFWTNGVRNGTDKQYFKNGDIEYERVWINGNLNGTQKHFRTDGTLKSEINYSNGKKRLMKLYGTTGKIEELDVYNEDEELIYSAIYYDDGSLRAQILPPMYGYSKDTIRLGNEYRTTIQLGVKVEGRLHLYTGTLKSELELIDLIEIPQIGNNVFEFSITPSQAGTHVVPFFFTLEPTESDTIKIDKMFTRLVFYVKEGDQV